MSKLKCYEVTLALAQNSYRELTGRKRRNTRECRGKQFLPSQVSDLHKCCTDYWLSRYHGVSL